MSAAHISRLQSIIIAPLVSEKTTASAERENSATFWVRPDATKKEIKQAVEKFFENVKVASVTTSRKARAFTNVGNRPGREKARKKAYVKLAQGEIQFTDFE